jgi:hypothetical protein
VTDDDDDDDDDDGKSHQEIRQISIDFYRRLLSTATMVTLLPTVVMNVRRSSCKVLSD